MDRNYWTSHVCRAPVYFAAQLVIATACGRGESAQAGVGGTGGASSVAPTAGQSNRNSGGPETKLAASGSGGAADASGGTEASAGEPNAAGRGESAGSGGAPGDLDAGLGGSPEASAGNAGNAGAAGEPTEPDPRPWKMVFITPDSFPSDFGRDGAERGIGAHVRADALCQQAAIDAELKGEFRAWLSTSAAGALDYFAALAMNGPWHRADDELVAEDLTALVSKSGLNAPILYTPSKALGGIFWTGTGPLGAIARNCDDFTNAILDGGIAAHCGLATQRDYGWSNSAFIACGSTGRALACFER